MKDQILIGREGCDIIVPSQYENVSRKHARISIANGGYVFEDLSSNGSYINGQLVSGQRVVIAPNTQVLLANQYPLPWQQIQALLPLQPVNGYGAKETVLGANPAPIAAMPLNGNQQSVNVNVVTPNPVAPAPQESLGCLLGGVCFLWPLVGWILYFVWKNDHPHKAKEAAKWAWIGFGVSFAILLIYYVIIIAVLGSLM